MNILIIGCILCVLERGLSKNITDVRSLPAQEIPVIDEKGIWNISSEHATTASNQRISDRVCKEHKRNYPPSRDIVFGGEDANPGGFPHMGAIGWRTHEDSKWAFKCGGSLISSSFLVTAAHCSQLRSHDDVVNRIPELVRLGVENIEDLDMNPLGQPIDKYIKRIIKHPQYRPPQKYFDIALIELQDKVPFSGRLHPACLWTKPNTNDDSIFNLSGWGLTERGSPSPHLQVAVVDILDTKQCDDLLKPYRNRNWKGFNDHQICSGKLTGKIDTCQGDSGGPLQEQIPDTSLYYIIGVTSFGVGCGKENQPGVYTRIYSFLDWIEENVWKDGIDTSAYMDSDDLMDYYEYE